MAPNRIHRLAFALVVVAALGVTSCSSSGSDADTTDAGSTTAARGDATTTTPGDAGGGAKAGKPLARYADYQTKNYDDPTHWVCRPDTPKDICHGDLDSTTVTADGKLAVVPFEAAEDPPIDCFYVYPTISRDKTAYSDWDASPDEEGYVTLNQAARLASQCRVFAPVYRQGTLAGLTSRLGGGSGGPEDEGDPFADVLDAFRTYMAEDNGGRGFVVIGHSQGAGMLNELIKQEIDPNADVRSKLVGGYLAGGTVAVPEGKVVGGDFQHVPVCTTADEAGCIMTWATFRSTAPPPSGSFFGKVRGGKSGEVASCSSPADPAGGKDVDALAYFPANSDASILSSLGTSTGGASWLDDTSTEKITTPFVSVPGLVTVECMAKDGFHFLQATVHADPGPRADDIPGDLTPEWGLHLIDVNLVMGNVVDEVGRQAKAYAG